ncbi:MAG: efflux RND transporter periplasmic adaptor subunit [Ferruginibacter sp.]
MSKSFYVLRLHITGLQRHWLLSRVEPLFQYLLQSVLFIFLAVISGVFMVSFSSCKSKPKTAGDPNIYYTCSMDPQVVESKPGKCPICHMELTAVNKSKGEKKDEIMLSEQQIQLGNIQSDTIRNGGMGDQLVLTATLNIDQSKTAAVSSRVAGRIERLYFKNLGDYITKGAPVYDLYSEELNSAKQEYLLALDRKKAFTNETAINFDELLQSAKNKLMLWGMSPLQIEVLNRNKKASSVTTFYSSAAGYITGLDVKEGDYVMDGGGIVKVAALSTLWAEAQVYTSQLSAIDLNGTAIVKLPDMEGKEIKGKVSFVNPEINPATRINLIRVSIPNTNNQLKPGMPTYVVLKSQQRNVLTLPVDAVIRDGKGAIVWTRTNKNTFKNKMVEVGLETDDRIEIRSGLTEGDVVIISGAYLLQSEYIFKKGANPMEAHAH